ncbi:MAG: hypothetical protein ACQEQE_07585 [Bacillota bacterium]
MNSELRLKVLQNIYTNQLVDSINFYNKSGKLDNILKEKKVKSQISGKFIVKKFKIETISQAFNWTNQIFDCAKWEKIGNNNIFKTKNCKLYNLAKKNGVCSPCKIYCLNPLEGMIKAIDKNYKFNVKTTLWKSDECIVRIE